jgi:hypothetical protein
MQTSRSYGRAEAPVQSRKSLRFLNNNFKAFIDLTPNMIATIYAGLGDKEKSFGFSGESVPGEVSGYPLTSSRPT